MRGASNQIGGRETTYGDWLPVDVDLELVTQGLRRPETYYKWYRSSKGKQKVLCEGRQAACCMFVCKLISVAAFWRLTPGEGHLECHSLFG